MKIKHLLLGAVAFVGAIVSCNKVENEEPTVTLSSQSVIEVEAAGADALEVKFTSTTAWELRGLDQYDWITSSAQNGKGSLDEQLVVLSVTPNPNANRTATLTIFASPLAKKTITVNQKGEKGDVESKTIAEFLELKDTKTAYKLTGKIGAIANSEKFYGFELKDETGEISCPFPANWNEYASKLHTGATVSVVGAYEFYESKNQHQVNDAQIVAHTPADESALQTISVNDFITKADKFSRYRLTGTISGNINPQYCSFDLKDDSGSIIVYTVNNAAEWSSKLAVNAKVTLVGAYTLFTSKTGETKHEVVDCDIESIEGGSAPEPGPSEDAIYSETFATGAGEWTIEDKNKPSELPAIWKHDAQRALMAATAYESASKVNYASESWLVSPVIDLTGESKAYLEFEQALNFFQNLETAKKETTVKVREENGSWENLTIPNYPKALGWTPVKTGGIDIVKFAGKKIQIALVYTSTATKAGTWQINNLKITKEQNIIEDVKADKTIIINDVKDLFASKDDPEYKKGFEANVDGVKVGFYQHKSTSTAVAPTDLMKVYKSSALRISAERPIKSIVLTTAGGKYCAEMTPLQPSDLKVTVEDPMITIEGNANEYILAADKAQVRVSIIEIVYAK